MQPISPVPGAPSRNRARGGRPGDRGRHATPAPMAWNRPQRRTVLAASAASILATALLLFAGG